MNTFGTKIRLTTFGESHGEIIGGVLDGIPSGFPIDVSYVNSFVDRRRPSDVYGGTARAELDSVKFISGLLNGITTGTPLAFIIENTKTKSADYNNLKNVNRPSHADFVYRKKYNIYDYNGGGRASARETLIRVVAGSICSQMITQKGVEFQTWIKQVGSIITPIASGKWLNADEYSLFPHTQSKQNILDHIEELKISGDSTGGIITCNIKGIPAGLGQPVYDKLNSRLAAAMFSINAVKGFEIGAGFQSASMKGSEYNDQPEKVNNTIVYKTNHDGGIQAGISNGNLVSFTVAFKPPSSISTEQQALNTNNEIEKLTIQGRHDSCIVPRAAVVVESMAAMVILDFYLQHKTDKWDLV